MLKELYCESFKENGKIRDKIVFSEGLNVVLGEKVNGEEHNSIGKSTLLLIIDYIFGGKNYKKSEAYNHGEQLFKFAFKFSDEIFYFLRTNNDDKVFECDSDYSVKSTITLEDYKDFLKKKYNLEMIDLKFREIVGPYSRVVSKDKNITPGHVLESNSIQNQNPVKIFEKLNEVYFKIKEKDELVFTADARNKVISQAKKLKVQLEETEKINIKEVESELESLENEKENLVLKQNEKVKELGEEKLSKILNLNKKLQILLRKRNKLKSRKTIITGNLENNAMPSKASFDALLDFFPGTDIKRLEEIENFHTKLTTILEDEYKETLTEIDNTLAELEPQITALQNEIQELEKDCGNFKIAFLEKFAEIDRKIKELKKKLERENQKKQEAKELKELKKQLKMEEEKVLGDLSNELNAELEVLSKEILEADINSVKINFPSEKTYSVSIPRDDGTGATYTSDLIFDIAVLEKTKLPFLIHDSYLYSNIRGKRLDRIILKYGTIQNKQIFIALDEIDKLERKTQNLINEKTRIKLCSNGGELFGEAWNK